MVARIRQLHYADAARSAGVVAAAAAFGGLSVVRPVLAAACAAAAAGVALLVRYARTIAARWAWWLVVACLAGALALDYGFANVGLSAPGAKLPVADLALLLLVLYALRDPSFRIPWSAPLLFACGLAAVATVRLAIDFPVWGQPAVRDYTMAVELGFLLVGAWSLHRFGLERWVRSVAWVFVLILPYLLLYPWRRDLLELGPTVGIQHPVPLLGTYWGAGTAAAAGLLFFALLRPLGRASYLVAAAFLPVVVMFQARGLYLALPAAIAGVWLLARGPAFVRARRGLVRVMAVGAVAVVLAFVFAPEGRVGQVTPGFVADHVGTVFGAAGPAEGSIDHRVAFAEDTLDRVRSVDRGWLVGVGLGPDLAADFTGAHGTAVRKPHNDYLEVFARLGAVGFVCFAGFVLTSLLLVVRAARRASGLEAAFLWWALGLAVVFFSISGTQPLLAYPHGTIPLFTVLGAALVLARSVGARPRGTP